MRILCLLVCFMWALPAFAEQTVIPNYEAARDDEFWPKLYQKGGRSLYCSKRFKKGGYVSSGTRMTLEHVVPADWMAEHFGCSDRNSCKVLKYLHAEADLHNLWPVQGRINSSRGDTPYGELPGESNRHMTNICRDYERTFGTGSIVEPQESAKGKIGRSMLHMIDAYDLKLPKGQKALARRWADSYPVTGEELWRNDAINEIQKTRNTYIDNAADKFDLDVVAAIEGFEKEIASPPNEIVDSVIEPIDSLVGRAIEELDVEKEFNTAIKELFSASLWFGTALVFFLIVLFMTGLGVPNGALGVIEMRQRLGRLDLLVAFLFLPTALFLLNELSQWWTTPNAEIFEAIRKNPVRQSFFWVEALTGIASLFALYKIRPRSYRAEAGGGVTWPNGELLRHLVEYVMLLMVTLPFVILFFDLHWAYDVMFFMFVILMWFGIGVYLYTKSAKFNVDRYRINYLGPIGSIVLPLEGALFKTDLGASLFEFILKILR